MRVTDKPIDKTTFQIPQKFDIPKWEPPVISCKVPVPTDNYLSKTLWDENTRAILYNTVNKVGISKYSPTILKDDNTAIAKSQTHLIDLLKYYEGDNYYYYEAITAPYLDGYNNWTTGFGDLSKSYTDQEKAYKKMASHIETFANEVKRVLDKKVGKGTYDSLPNSIKEALIDLDYNKGLNKISSNKTLIDAIKRKDYSKVVANLPYVYSGKENAAKIEDPGLYRRSLSRAILATRDLKGSEKKEAQKEVQNIYNKAKKCYKANNTNSAELDKIYEQYTTGKISSKARSAEAYKITIDQRFQGKGLMAVAQEAYKALGPNPDVAWVDFYKEFKRINRNPEQIMLGTQMSVPYAKNIKKSKPTQSTSQGTTQKTKQETKTSTTTTETPKSDKNKGFWNSVCDGVKGFFGSVSDFFKSVGKFFKGLFGRKSSKKETNQPENETVFQKMVKEGNIKEQGDFQIITQDYEVKQGDSLWGISKTYGTSESIICADNELKDKNVINVGQKLSIQKLGYKIKPGDNLYQISKKFGLNVEILKDLNNWDDADKIQANQIMEIPGFTYKIAQGDTLFKIAQEVGVSVQKLMEINNLTSDVIKPGQTIIIVYNNSDYGISDDNKQVVIDKKTHTKTEIINVARNTTKLNQRPLLKQKTKVNDKVVATRKVFAPTKAGKLSGKTIIVNAGHGYSQAGTDIGTPGIKGMDDEWLLNYDNAMRLKDQLCALGAKVIFLQGKKRLIVNEISKKENKADMFISVHVNSFGKPTQDRTQIYYRNKGVSKGPKAKSIKLSKIMEKNFDKWIPKHENISNNDKFVNQGKQDYAQSTVNDARTSVLEAPLNEQNIPGVLWEVGFMSTSKGRERLSNANLMTNYANVMAQSVVEYFG